MIKNKRLVLVSSSVTRDQASRSGSRPQLGGKLGVSATAPRQRDGFTKSLVQLRHHRPFNIHYPLKPTNLSGA
jgi:3-polyprenyl-4-hydroxybenzoate decarboxylase